MQNNVSKQHYVQNGLDWESDFSIFNAFEDSPSIKNIKNKNIDSTFKFSVTYSDEVMKMIKNSDIAKSFQMYDTTTAVIKINI